MAAQTYTDILNSVLAGLSAAPPPYSTIPPDFAQLFPQAISYAENRIYREIVFLAQRRRDVSLTTTPGSREIDTSATPLPLLVLEGFALQVNSVAYPFDEVMLDVVDIIWPDSTLTLSPAQAEYIGRYWAMLDEGLVVISPTPTGAYTVVLTGIFQPETLSLTTPSTYLSRVYPELLEAAIMVWMEGWFKANYGAAADDPRSAVAFEAQYTTLRDSAMIEEQRRRGQGAGWSPQLPTPLAQPGRTA